MKKNNLIEMLQGCSMRNGMPVSASNPDGGQTCDGNRQSRLMSYRGYLRNLAMIFAILTLSIGQMWATDVYVWDGNTSETKLSKTSYTNDTDHEDGTTGFVFRLTGWKDGLVDITGYTNYSTYGKSKGIQQGGSNASNNNVKLVIPEGYTASVHVVYALTGSQPKYFGLNATPEVQPDGKNCSAWNVTVTSDKTLQDATIKALKAGTYYLLGNANNCVFAEIKVTLTPSGCTSYSFHYGTHDASDWTIKCFEYSGAGDVYYVNNFIIPDKPNFYVGNQGVFYNSNLGLGWGENKGPSRSVEDAWSNLPFAASQGDGSGTRPKVGAATGAKGKIRVHDTSNWNNMFVAFIPDGYKLKIGSTEYPFTLESGNEFRSDIVELSSSNARSNISVGVIDGSGNYVATANSEGMQHIFLNTGGTTYWSKDGVNNFGLYDDTEGHKYFTCLMTQVPGENNLYEGWVPSNCTKVIFCRLKSSTPEWGEGNSNVYNYTNSLSLLTNQNYWTVTGWNGGDGFWSAYAKKGEFRMYDNSKDKNWYVHFCPYHVLHYDANGGSDAPADALVAADAVPCQWSLSTTQPTWADHVFLGWSTNSSATVADADAEVADLGKPYGATGDVTLYAVWEACSGPNAGTSTWTAAGYTYAQNATANEMSLTGVTASNGGDLSYQWYKTTSDVANGEAISGATSDRYTPATDVAHAENWFYFCRVTEAGCSKTYTSALSGAIVVNEPVDPCSEPAKVANEIARFFVPCNQAAGDVWNPSGVDASTGSNTFTITNNLGGSGDFGGDNWKRNATTGFKYGKMQKNTTIQLQLKSDSRFQAGDIVTVYVNGTSNNVKMNTGSDVSFGESAASGYDGEYTHTKTLAADNIEGDGSIIIKRTDAIFINRIIVTRPPVAASITATLLTPAYMPTGASGVQIGVTITGASTGWYYRVKKVDGGYQNPDPTPYTTSTWTMTSGIGAGANTYVVELYDGTNTRQATSNTITVTGETGHQMTILAGAGGSVSPSGLIYANGENLHPEITATPDAGYHFVNWTLSDANATLANANTATTTITNAIAACTITANFEEDAAPATKDIYYGHVKITDGALVREIPSGATQFFTNIGGTVANTTEISLSSTPSTPDMYYNSNNLTDAELSKSSNWSTSSTSNRYIRGLKFANGTTYTLALGTKVASAITFYGWCGRTSKVMTIGGEEYTSSSTKKTFAKHEFTKSGGFTDNVSITQTGDFYGIIVVTVAALPFCTTPTMPSDVTSTICEADSKPTWNATPENAATITGASQTISYSWKKEGSDTELATTATYTPTTNGTYKCTVTVSKASHISRTAVMTCTLVINSAPDKPTISGNTTGTVGNNVLLTASTTIAAASYQWYKDGVAIGSATSATYNANEASAGSYDYTVTATNSCGTSSASNAHTVTFSEAAENVTPIISASLESACVGATITLTATTYHPSATLTWYKDGVTTGQTGTTYTISTAAAGDSGVYTLKSVLGGTEDLTSDGITITINTAPAAFSDFRTAYSVDAEATSVTLNATATGATSYAWYSATKENATTGGVLLAEVTTTSYSASLAGVAEGKEYYFYCIAENACGNNSAAATTVTVTAVSLEECLDMTDASDAGAPELEGTYATLSGTTSGTNTVSSLTYIKLGSSSNYIQLEAETGYTFATVTAVLVANYSNQKMVYATSTNGSSWTYTEYTLSGDAKVRRTLVIDVPANTKYVQIWRQADGKGQANTLYVDPEICYEMKMECATPPTFQFEKPASTKITADSYTMGSGAYTSPMLNKGSLAGSVTYSSSDESVATVNSSGVVTILDAGSTTIKAIYAGDATYCTTQAYYVLTVSCQIPAPELTTDGSSVACSSSITITARNSSTHAAYAGDAAGGTYEWYRNGDVMVGEDDASITVEVTGTYYVVYTKDDCSQRSTNVATVTSEVREPSAQRLTPFQYYKYNHTYYQVGDPDIPGGTDPDIVGPMRHLFKVTPSRLVDGKPCQVKKEIIRADVSLGAATVVTDSYIKYEDNKDGSYNVMLDLNALTTLNKVEERLVLGDTLVLTATPFDACSDPATSETKSIKVYVIDESKHPLAFIVSGASGDGTKTKGQLVLNGDFLTGYNKADLCLQTGLTTWNPSAELPLYTGLKADPKFIVVPVNGYATFNQLNYEPFELLLLTDFVVTDGSGTKSDCASIVNDMAALVDYRPILSLKAHMAKKELANWAAKGFTTLPEVPERNPVNTMKVLCYAHPMFDGASGAVTDPETGLTTITMTSGGGFDKNKALQGFQSAGLSGFVFIASIDGGSKGTLYSCIERQNKIDARMVVISVNGNAHSQINSYGQSAIIKTLEYLLDTDPVKVSDCTVTFDNGASYADYNEEAYHAAGGTGSKGDGLWATAANWSTKKLPLADQNIKINADVTVTGDRSVLSVRFNDNYKMTIAPSGSLSVPGYISKVVDGELVDITETNRITIQSNDVQTGVLIHSQKSGTLAATVQLVSKSYSKRVEEDGKIKKKKYWQYIGLPVQSALAEDAFYGAYTYKYNEPSGWEKKGTGTTLEEFWGIGLSVDNIALGIPSPVTFNISGALALATDRDIELTKTAEAGKGQNMIGNSWTAPIHLVNMTDDDFENATATIYIYNTGRDEQAPGGDVGTSTFADGSTQPGQWISIPVGVAKLNPWKGPKVIPAMQAFEVDVAGGATSGTLHLNYDKHVRNIGTPVEEHAAISAPKRYRTDEPSMMRLRVADTATYTDLYLIEGEEFSDEFDNGYDGKYQQCDGRSATLYALSPIGNMAVLAQQSINNTAIVFRPGRQNEYTFTFGYNGEVAYYLNDLLLEQSTEIREGNEYRFTCNEGDMESRFVVSTTPFGAPDITTGIGNTGHPEKVQKIMYKDHIYIIRAGRVYDIVGKEVR